MKTGHTSAWALAFSITLAAVSGCATLPDHPTGAPSHAFADTDHTTLGGIAAGGAWTAKGESGIAILDRGEEALLARIALIDLAEKSVDLQYYCWYPDRVGRLLVERLLRAADRGVRVRMLVDDVELAGRDLNIAALSAHPNFEVRLFNPFSVRFGTGMLRMLEMLINLEKLDHRMHNKTFVVDNQAAIVGGRNIADEYFGVSPELDYRDFDLLVFGPAAAQVSECFDTYWADPRVYPISDVYPRQFTKEELDTMYARLRTYIATLNQPGAFPYPLPKTHEESLARVVDAAKSAIGAKTEMVFDDPKKGEKHAEQPSHIRAVLMQVRSQHELVMINPYFVPQQKFIEELVRISKSGVKVRVLTNSLASTDMVPAQSGYEKCREELLRAGVSLYELRPDAAARAELIAPSCPHAILALHAKVLISDGQRVFVGSMNLDPRSHRLNTEGGILIDSPELTRQVTEKFDVEFQPENSWRLGIGKDGELTWTTRRDGRDETTNRDDPDTSFWQRFKCQILKVMPIGDEI